MSGYLRQCNALEFATTLTRARRQGFVVLTWRPGDGWTRYRVAHVPSLPAAYHTPGAEITYDSVYHHQLITSNRHDVWVFLRGVLAVIDDYHLTQRRPVCVDCGDAVTVGINDPTRPGDDGASPDSDPDPLCSRCFAARHSADRLADAAEQQNEDRIRG